jgi:hypothetical protein
MRDLNLRRHLATVGVHFPDTAVEAQPGWAQDWRLAADANPHLVNGDVRSARIAMDAQPGAITTPNAGIPGFLTNIIDPEVIRVFTQPMRAAEIFGETKKGDWTTLTTQFPTIESAGQVASYGDYNNNGTTSLNANYVPRQSYAFQTIKRYGEREQAIWSLASIDKSAELDIAAAYVMAKFQNRSYFFGIAGLQNYGMLNEPTLIAPITPSAKAAGGTTWTLATAQEIYQDVLNLYTQLNIQMGGNINMRERLTLVLSTTRESMLSKVSQYNITARQTLLENFPNLKIETAPEYSTAGGELVQLFLPTFEGRTTAYGAFTEKMRAHPLIADLSSWKQKMSGGTWGAIFRRPVALAQMLGV